MSVPPVIGLRDFVLLREDGTRLIEAKACDLEPGVFARLVGASSSGKSALLAALAMQRDNWRGAARLFGDDIAEMSRDMRARTRRRMGLALARPRFVEAMTARHNLALAPAWGASLRGAKAAERADIMLVWAGLQARAETPAGALDRSERARLALARAIMRAPALLLVDDPTDDLTPDDHPRWTRLLEAAHEGGATILFAARSDDVMPSARTSLLRLRDGRLVLDSAA